jgi:hypothetical protein
MVTLSNAELDIGTPLYLKVFGNWEWGIGNGELGRK